MGRTFGTIPLCYQTQERKTNVITYALSIRHTLLIFLGSQILVFDNIKELYVHDTHICILSEKDS